MFYGYNRSTLTLLCCLTAYNKKYMFCWSNAMNACHKKMCFFSGQTIFICLLLIEHLQCYARVAGVEISVIPATNQHCIGNFWLD